MNSWIILIIAGICEVVWALGLKFSNGFTKAVPTTITVLFMILSGYLLALAVRQIPIGIAYSVWVGIGVVGAFLGGILMFHEKVHWVQIASVIMIIIGILGLKFYSVEH